MTVLGKSHPLLRLNAMLEEFEGIPNLSADALIIVRALRRGLWGQTLAEIGYGALILNEPEILPE